VRRIVVIGCPGNGKTTLARQLAAGLGIRHVELDGLFHVADWASATADEFRHDLAVALDDAPGGWVTCGNYLTMSGELHIARADTLVWLDLPRRVVTWRTAKRTLRRSLTREPLFGNGLTEPVGNFTRWDPDKNIVRWAWIHHPIYREDFFGRIESPAWEHLDIRRLTTPDEIDGFLAGAIGRQR